MWYLSKSNNNMEVAIKQQQWCSVCIIPAAKDCQDKNHKIQSYNYVLNAYHLKLKMSLMNETCSSLEYCDQVNSVNQQILAWINWLQSQSLFGQMAISNSAVIDRLKALKKYSSQLCAVSMEECNMNDLKNMIFNKMLEEAEALKSQVIELMHTYKHSYVSTQQEMGSEGSTAETLNLDHWFSTSLSPKNQSWIDVLTFLIRFLRAKQAQLANTASGNIDGTQPEMQQVSTKRIQEDPVPSSSTCKKLRPSPKIKVDKDISLTLTNIGNIYKDMPPLVYYPPNQSMNIGNIYENMPPLVYDLPSESRNKGRGNVVRLGIRAVGPQQSIPQEMYSISQQPSALVPSNLFQKLSILLREETCKCKCNEEEQPNSGPATQAPKEGPTTSGEETLRKSEEISNRITRLRVALASTVRHRKFAEEMLVKALHEDLTQVKPSEETQEVVKMKMAHLNSVFEESEQCRFQLAAAFKERERFVMADEIIDSLQTELEEIQEKFWQMEEAQAESSARLEDLQFVNTQFQFVNSQLISTQQKLKEEVRLANERAEELVSERAEMIAKHHEEIRNIYAETSQHLQSDEENLSIDTSLVPVPAPLVPAPLLINYCDCGTPVNVWERRSRRPRRRNRNNRPSSYY